VSGAHPVGDLVDGPREIGAGVLDLGDQHVRRHLGALKIGLSHVGHSIAAPAEDHRTIAQGNLRAQSPDIPEMTDFLS
jgi:hypothetical protein